ncbi:hypothetical protein [Corynebacterium vitaeruminis]|uniref:hypothetical protein n=1 Tax=Corynebacterium vitaeruminis TaxID=38305 RepID=UPI000551BA05|nr:hypothetical protein [Corynebacterium vitaeruminis]
MTLYTTRTEAIRVEIIGTLEPYAHEFDVQAIANEVLEVVGDGVGYRYRLRPGIDDDAFWQMVKKHALI